MHPGVQEATVLQSQLRLPRSEASGGVRQDVCSERRTLRLQQIKEGSISVVMHCHESDRLGCVEGYGFLSKCWGRKDVIGEERYGCDDNDEGLRCCFVD